MTRERPPEPGSGGDADRDADDKPITADEGPNTEEDDRRPAEESEPPAAEEMAGPS